MKKLAIISTHPIQYNAPWFRLLAQRGRVEVMVFYTWSQVQELPKYDPGFKRVVEWDIPLLSGYPYTFVENTSSQPGTRSYKGIVNPGLITEVERYQPDAILVHGWNFKSHLQCIKYFHGKIPVLFRGDSTLLDPVTGLRKLLRRLVLRNVYKKVDHACYVGQANRDYFLAHGLQPEQLSFVPHAIDNERFEKGSCKESEISALKIKLGLAPGDLVFLFAGKLEPKKDPAVMIRAFREAGMDHAHLVIVGNGELEKQLKEASGNDAHIHFVDFQNQSMMPLIYGICDVFILPSKGPGETWGLAVNEAMACNKPVIVSDRCGCAADLVQEGRNGYVFRAGDVKGLTEIMRSMHSNRSGLVQMGQASGTLIARYSFDHIVSAIEAIVHTKPRGSN